MLFKCSLKNAGLSINIPKLPYPYELITDKIFYYKGKLSEISKNLNFMGFNTQKDCDEYIEVNGDYIDVEKYTLHYCTNDVIITKNFVELYYSYFLLNYIMPQHIPLTTSSLAIKIFLNNPKIFGKLVLDLDESTKDAQKYARSSYFGGRTEVFGNTEDKIFYFDFPGFYPSVGRGKFGAGDLYKIPKNIDIKKFNYGFCRAKVSSNMRIPILPIYTENRLVFPNGKFESFFYLEELNYFEEMGGKIIEIKDGYYFKDANTPLRKYFDEFTAYRNREPVNICKPLGKFMNNCLYGRLAMQDKNTVVISLSPKEYEIFKHEIDEYSHNYKVEPSNLNFLIYYISILNNHYHYLQKKYLSNPDKYPHLSFIKFNGNYDNEIKSNIFLASAITSKGRILLHKAISKIEDLGGKVLYCDTDSIFCTFKDGKDKNNNDILDRDLANFDGIILRFDSSKQDTVIEKGIFLKPKQYSLKYDKGKTSTKLKGVSPKYLGDDIFEKFYNRNELVFKDMKYFSKKGRGISASEVSKKINIDGFSKRK
jgi:hypothetical protein